MITNALVEQHIHGAFGIDFMHCSVEELLEASQMLVQYGVGIFFPTIMTDDIDVIKDRIDVVKKAKSKQSILMAQIAGVHLEGPFINPEKAGIHNKNYILPLEIEKFQKIEDDIIKIITIAPELDTTGDFLNYISGKNIKISLGHSTSSDMTGMNQVTHLYNAMSSFHHREQSAVVSALTNDDIYTEIIADSMHVNDKVLKLTFKQKPKDKIILISDALPLAHSDKESMIFAGQEIFNRNGKLVNSEGVLAGSSSLLCDIIKNLADKNIIKFENALQFASSNLFKYHNLSNNLNVYWNDSYTIEKVEFI